VTVPEHFLEALVAELADALAPKVAAELATRSAVPAAGEEPWRLLDVEQTGARLGRSTRWVRERAKRGELPFVKLDGGGLAFRLEDLQEFARARLVPPDGRSDPLAGRLRPLGDPAPGARSRAPDRVGNRRVAP
jgi:hypothetical protein